MSLLGLLFEGFWLRGAKEGTGGSCSDKVVPFLIYNSTRNKKQGQKKEKMKMERSTVGLERVLVAL